MKREDVFKREKLFFVIDSNNIAEVCTELYGFAIVENSLVEAAEKLNGKDPLGDGAYVYVKRLPEKIIISQDYIGSFGLYLFKEEGYFALSNSFAALVDHIKSAHKISFNKAFADYILAADLCSAAYSETMVKEITLLDRSAVVELSIPDCGISIDYIDYCENTVELSSEEGMRILDSWYNKWTALIRNLESKGCRLKFDLSGGFDSRMTFSLLVGSGVDTGKVFVSSINDKLHTHSEDYAIASQIAEHYGFKLNERHGFGSESAAFSLEEIIDISFYLKLCFHKQMYSQSRKNNTLQHYFGGSGGECVRSYWNISEEEFIEKAAARSKRFPIDAALDIENSTGKILSASFSGIKSKFERFGRKIAPEDIALNLYRETRCRNHFGKDVIENYSAGLIKYTPLLDRELHRLKLDDANCADRNLLAAVIFCRYCPQLLGFKFDSHRSISAKTIRYAQELSSAYPYSSTAPKSEAFRSGIKEANSAAQQSSGKSVSREELSSAVEKIFASPLTADPIKAVYSAEVYESLRSDVKNRKYQPLESAYTAIGISKVIRDVLISRELCSESLANALISESELLRSGETENAMQSEYLRNYITARIDIKNTSSDSCDIELSGISEKSAKITRPEWLCKGGNGCCIEAQSGKLLLNIKCIGGGTLSISLKGRDVRGEDGARVPFWIDYTRIEINGQPCIEAPTAAWHDKPIVCRRSVADGEIISLLVEWQPHDERKLRVAAQGESFAGKIVRKASSLGSICIRKAKTAAKLCLKKLGR